MKLFRKCRDDRFALTTLHNPTIELRSYAERVQAAQPERENQAALADQPILISSAPVLENDVNQ
ncbi:MAG: hypothetical protein ABSC10_00790 [Candidatus Acidiferrales bacterium]|jgi:hypothetical protein